MLSQLVELIESKQRFAAVSHIRPDGDGLGSSLGLYWVLKALGKEVEVISRDPVPIAYQQLPGARQVRVTLNRAGHRGLAMFVTVLVISMSTLVPSQISTAVGRSNDQLSPHCAALSGAQWISGGNVSTIVTVWLQNEALPQPSLARHVRVTLSKPDSKTEIRVRTGYYAPAVLAAPLP